MKIIDLSQNIEMGRRVYPSLVKTLINTWNTIYERARVQGGGKMAYESGGSWKTKKEDRYGVRREKRDQRGEDL